MAYVRLPQKEHYHIESVLGYWDLELQSKNLTTLYNRNLISGAAKSYENTYRRKTISMWSLQQSVFSSQFLVEPQKEELSPVESFLHRFHFKICICCSCEIVACTENHFNTIKHVVIIFNYLLLVIGNHMKRDIITKGFLRYFV